MNIKITHHPIKSIVFATIIAGIIGLAGWQISKDTSSAADIRNFNPGNIMSDIVMSNKNTMSVQSIQNFLNSKNYCDNRNTHLADQYPHLQYNIKDGRFVCMARESFNGKSAAQLIWKVGQDYNINPQVLIVLLEKEQGLITDTWPNNVQYRTATGYGCPDTAPCDSQYYGLENQLRLAAKLFRDVLNGGWSNYPVGNRYVQYHPNAACGGSVVNIQNRATSALYRYTPYQPNQSALNAGYGKGDDCGAYGNRNFWRLFTDWFGATHTPDTLNPHPDGTLVDIDGGVYLIQSGELHHIINGTVFASHSYRWQDIKPGTTGDRKLPITWPVDFIAPGVLYSGDSTGVYTTIKHDGAWVKQLVSYASFTKLGYDWDRVRNIPKSHLPSQSSLTIYTSTDRHPEGTLINDRGSVYLIDNGTRRYVNAKVFESNRWSWDDILPIKEGDKLLPMGTNVLLRQGSLVSSGPDLFIVAHQSSGPEIMRPIGPYECLSAVYKYKPGEAVAISPRALPVARGPLVTC